jgi:hypothetical protein
VLGGVRGTKEKFATKIQPENLKGSDSLGGAVFGRGDDVIF